MLSSGFFLNLKFRLYISYYSYCVYHVLHVFFITIHTSLDIDFLLFNSFLFPSLRGCTLYSGCVCIVLHYVIHSLFNLSKRYIFLNVLSCFGNNKDKTDLCVLFNNDINYKLSANSSLMYIVYRSRTQF